jgi:hypothetical protein
MKILRLANYWRFEKLLLGVVLTGLLGSSVFTANASSLVHEVTGHSGPVSFRSASPLFRNYALTTVTGQRTASNISKQSGVKRPLTFVGPALTESNAAPETNHQLFVTTDPTFSYLSFRLLRRGGRAPPVSV